MKTLYLHIGTQKTGTTSIQGFCKDNGQVLESKGYCYPIFPYTYPRVSNDRNAHFLMGRILDADGNRMTEKEKRIYQEGMNTIQDLFLKYDNVILSDEHIWQTTFRERPDFWEQIKQEGENYGFQVKIIVYLRRQDEFIGSLWNQVVKIAIRPERCQQTFDEYIDKLPGISQLDYYQKLESISNVLGMENVIVRVFEKSRFYCGSIYADFLKTINLDLTEEFKILQKVKNLGLAGNTHEIKRILNSLPELKDKKKNNFLRDILLDFSEISKQEYPSAPFSPEETAKFLDKYKESNERVLKEYLHEDGTFLFHQNIADTPKWQKDNPYMTDDLIRFVGMCTIHLMDEITHLREEQKKLKEAQNKQHQWLTSISNQMKHPIRTLFRRIFKKN